MNLDTRRRILLKVFIYGQLLLEANDDLITTNSYKQKLKHYSKGLVKELEKEISTQVDDIYASNPEAMSDIFKVIDSVVNVMSSMKLEDFDKLNNFLKTIEDENR